MRHRDGDVVVLAAKIPLAHFSGSLRKGRIKSLVFAQYIGLSGNAIGDQGMADQSVLICHVISVQAVVILLGIEIVGHAIGI